MILNLQAEMNTSRHDATRAMARVGGRDRSESGDRVHGPVEAHARRLTRRWLTDDEQRAEDLQPGAGIDHLDVDEALD